MPFFEREIEKLRKLMWFAVGFTAACALGAYLLFDNFLLMIALLCLVAFVGCCFVKNKPAKIAAAILLGIFVGGFSMWGYRTFYLDTAKTAESVTAVRRVEITDYSRPTQQGISAEGKIRLDGKAYKIRVYTDTVDTLSPGDVFVGSMELRFTGAGGEKGASYHQGDGIFLLGYAEKESTVVRAERIPNKYFAAQLRQKILNCLDSMFPEDTLGFARALLLGETDRLSYKADVDFQRSGIRHVVAVSGLHISILFSLVYLVTVRQRHLTLLLGIPVLLLFAAIAGFTPSVVRACVMQGLIVLALLVDREYDPPTALSSAVLVILIANPLTVTSVSFQLSVGCIVGMFLFSGKIHKFLYRGKIRSLGKGKGLLSSCVRWIVNSVSISVSATIVTVPVSAFYFGTVSVLSVLTNILTLWVVSTIFYGVMIACALGFLWPAAGKALAWCVSWLMRYVMLVEDWISGIPFATVYTQSVYILAWLIFAYVLLAVFLICKKRKPLEFLCCIAVSLAICITCSCVEPYLDNYRVTVLDVGQGQCILLQSDGKTYMVDCGGSYGDSTSDAAIQQLCSQGVTKLDGLIVTEIAEEHTNAMENLMTQISVKRLYLPKGNDTIPLLDSNVPISRVGEDMVLEGSGFQITLFAPEDGESGMCVLFQAKKCDILITGDRDKAGEAALLRRTRLPKLEFLIAGDHGGKNATGTELLGATEPKTVVISSAKNSYRTPAKELLDRLDLYGIPVLRTDRQGTLILRG